MGFLLWLFYNELHWLLFQAAKSQLTRFSFAPLLGLRFLPTIFPPAASEENYVKSGRWAWSFSTESVYLFLFVLAIQKRISLLPCLFRFRFLLFSSENYNNNTPWLRANGAYEPRILKTPFLFRN